ATTGTLCQSCAEGYLPNSLGVCTQPDPDCPSNCLSCEPFGPGTLTCESGTTEGTVTCTLTGVSESTWYTLYTGADIDFVGNANTGSGTSVTFGPYPGDAGAVFWVGTADENDQTVFIASTQDRCTECGAPRTPDTFGSCVVGGGPQ
ncbi:MAG: hypothetical protein KC635_15565, partial [Myxococcales bacterium]|nr:hypothetical protein [Myxococcales bacterium]